MKNTAKIKIAVCAAVAVIVAGAAYITADIVFLFAAPLIICTFIAGVFYVQDTPAIQETPLLVHKKKVKPMYEHTPDILPCPFCGSMPVLVTGGEHFAYIECPSCGAKLPASTGKNKNTDAINAWNMRNLSMREKEMYQALKNARKELLNSAREYIKNTIYAACEIQDLLKLIDSEKTGDNYD